MNFLLIVIGVIVILAAVLCWFWMSDYEEDEVIEKGGPVTAWTLRNNLIVVFTVGLLALLAGLFI